MHFLSYLYLLLTSLAGCPKLFASFPFVVCGLFLLLGWRCLVCLDRCFVLRSGFRCVFDIQGCDDPRQQINLALVVAGLHHRYYTYPTVGRYCVDVNYFTMFVLTSLSLLISRRVV